MASSFTIPLNNLSHALLGVELAEGDMHSRENQWLWPVIGYIQGHAAFSNAVMAAITLSGGGSTNVPEHFVRFRVPDSEGTVDLWYDADVVYYRRSSDGVVRQVRLLRAAQPTG